MIDSLGITRNEILDDYSLAVKSRLVSVLGRKEVLNGRAKFGIFGAGKELAQLALAKEFKDGDFRAGYYRDQTMMFALNMLTFEQFFAQLYGHADVQDEPASGGRAMNSHFATRSINPDGTWKNLLHQKNSSADVSPTGAQMPRMVGLAYASRLYRELGPLPGSEIFSDKGKEIVFGTIGNASCAEGIFWESINAAAVLKAPMVLSIWDDGYGISVPNNCQFSMDLSKLISGFGRIPDSTDGYELFRVEAWDYMELIKIYREAARLAREDHIPSIIHVVEVTQPLGHSTSGSHERYKSKERLAWETEFDCNKIFREWIIEHNFANEDELLKLEEKAEHEVKKALENAYRQFKKPYQEALEQLEEIFSKYQSDNGSQLISQFLNNPDLNYGTIAKTIHEFSKEDHSVGEDLGRELLRYKEKLINNLKQKYSTNLLDPNNRSDYSFVEPVYSKKPEIKSGFQLLNTYFENLFERNPYVLGFGEDVGNLGGVNQAFAGLQEKFGEMRVGDAGIREATIIGQAIGLAMRGFRPIAEIQYLDYLLYALQIMSDDLATVRWRTNGGQIAPVIIRTRGHRLEGIWHSGSPMAGIINLVRGMHVVVPRNMVQAAGFYNTLIGANDPGLVVEVLNAYRLKEQVPENLGEIKLPLGIPEVIREGGDITIVTYGALCKIAVETADRLAREGIETEIIDVRTLLPFDTEHMITESIKKTNRVIFLDEDVPGGTSAYMFNEVLEKQGAYYWLDSPPATISAKEHRPAYGSDGNYWSKPNHEDIYDKVFELMNEAAPAKYPIRFRG